ncbi:MAG: DUF3089 domain-containing protein [Burkholderiaceae bacterium]
MRRLITDFSWLPWIIPVSLLATFGPTQGAVPDPNLDTYASSQAWICRPHRQDACADDLSSTSVTADGERHLEPWQPNPDAQIDCFYVYPTVSTDPNGNSSLVPGTDEVRAVRIQFGRFASVCRPFAPVYRQMTLAGLSARIQGAPLKTDPELGFQDIRAAWKHYLRYDNGGRGVVLIGHSQGSSVLIELLQRDIEGTPQQSRLISAILLGMNVEVPKGQQVGGTFRHLPLCTTPRQTGCVIAYESFRAQSPPPPGSRFGRATTAGMEVACTDPVALSGEPIGSFLPTRRNLLGQPQETQGWSEFIQGIATPFVSLPGLIDAHCVSSDEGSYLAISVTRASGDPRPSDIPGDLLVQGRLLSDWGLHLIDVNLALGNLIEIVEEQGRAYRLRHSRAGS